MKAVLFRKHGGPEVLEYAEVPDPQIGQDEILVRVKACSLNHLDLWIRNGIPAYQIQLPHIAGADVAGIIERVGEGISQFHVGDRVILSPGLSCGKCAWCQISQDNRCDIYGIRGAKINGGYAEMISALGRDAIFIPSGMSFEVAAAFPLVFLTAWHMLVTRAKLQAGERVLIHAAGSGIGHAAIQIAKHIKAVVYTTVGSEAKVPSALALGVEEVILYTRESVEDRIKTLTDGKGVQVVFEHVGPATWSGSLKVLAKGGRLVTCGSTSGPSVSLDLRYVFSRHLSLLGSTMGTRAELLTVTQLIGEGAFGPIIDTVFPLREARAAQERMERREVFGKLLLAP